MEKIDMSLIGGGRIQLLFITIFEYIIIINNDIFTDVRKTEFL